MRLLALMLLLVIAPAVLADGAVLPSPPDIIDIITHPPPITMPEIPLPIPAGDDAFRRLRETDQVAVMHLAPAAVTVDMYIAITGIPEGQTITYLLPFWHRPEDFTLEEMEGAAFRERYVQPAVKQLILDSEADRHPILQAMTPSFALLGTALYGPLSPAVHFPAFALVQPAGELKTVEDEGSISQGTFSPYATASTPAAKAELFRVEGEADLQALIARAGLPAQYLEALRAYQTSDYALMRLTGLPASAGQARGVHYHLRHPMPESGYTYTYPLGTGAAWPQPILLTELFVTCEPGYALTVNAPTYGKEIAYEALVANVRAALQGTPPGEPATASLGGERELPMAWHRAYFNCNPDMDLTVQLTPRSDRALYQGAALFTRPGVTLALSLVCLLVAWAFSFRLVILPAWLYHGRPGDLTCHLLRIFGQVGLAGVASGMLILGVLALLGPRTEITAGSLFTAGGHVPWLLIPLAVLGGGFWLVGRWVRYSPYVAGRSSAVRLAITLLPMLALSVITLFVLAGLRVLPPGAGAVTGGLTAIGVIGALFSLASLHVDGELPRSTPVFAWLAAAGIYLVLAALVLAASSLGDLALNGNTAAYSEMLQ